MTVGQVAGTLTLIAGLWLMTFSYLLAYPFTINGVDARLRDMGLGFVLVLLGTARIRFPSTAWRACLASGAAGLALIVMPFALGYGPPGTYSVAWWNELLTGVVVVLFGLLGLAVTIPRRAAPPRSTAVSSSERSRHGDRADHSAGSSSMQMYPASAARVGTVVRQPQVEPEPGSRAASG